VKKIVLLCTTAMMPSAVYAQSTGTVTTEGQSIVITGAKTRGVAGVVIPDVPKTRSVLTNEILMRQSEGQSILQTINLVPGVNYTNNDPYGSSGGNLRIRGFPGNRVALLWDGLPLNDTGNYAIFGNQQMDQEIIDQVSVNLGTTDVDSPTPSAAGGVVSYRTRLPANEMAARLKASVGDFNYHRFFGMLDSGEFTSFGTRAFIAASDQKYDKFRGPGQLKKDQVNARIYQPLGSSGDFVSLGGHFNRNRNNSYNNGLVTDYAVNPYFDNIGTCVRDAPTPGTADNDGSGSSTNITQPASCTNYYNLRINPSDTWNLRGSAKITLMDGLILTMDPGYQSTLANGGGTATIFEKDARLRGNSTVAGVDLNGDADTLDTIRLYQPSNTRTQRYTFLSSLIWEASHAHRLRVAYTFDRGHHRQTGEFGNLEPNGDPISVFGGKYDMTARVITADGAPLQNRDRLSIAMLNQLSFEYFGRFFEDRLKVTAGLRAPWFKRELNQNCYTSNGSNTFGGASTAAGGVSVTAGNPYCTTQTTPILPGATPSDPFAGAKLAVPLYFLPFERTVKYSPLLPSGGVSYDFGGGHSVYASYGKNFSSPSTDNLYRSVTINPDPEFTNSYEAGYRFSTGRVQAQLAGYWVDYKNRIVTAADLDPASPTFGSTLDRNVGDARAYGFDGQVSWRPSFVNGLSLYSYLSYIDSRLKEDVLGLATATATNSPCPPSTPVGQRCTVVAVPTKGAEFTETPRWTWGGRVSQDVGPFQFGMQFKHVGKRWSTDDNGRTLATSSTGGQTAGQPFILVDSAGRPISVSGLPIATNGRTNAYNVVDVDARVQLKELGVPASVRFNITNLFDKYYFANINTQNSLSGGPRYSVGAPRTFQATLELGF
jgi:iron complex outermembrane receptor protein